MKKSNLQKNVMLNISKCDEECKKLVDLCLGIFLQEKKKRSKPKFLPYMSLWEFDKKFNLLDSSPKPQIKMDIKKLEKENKILDEVKEIARMELVEDKKIATEEQFSVAFEIFRKQILKDEEDSNKTSKDDENISLSRDQLIDYCRGVFLKEKKKNIKPMMLPYMSLWEFDKKFNLFGSSTKKDDDDDDSSKKMEENKFLEEVKEIAKKEIVEDKKFATEKQFILAFEEFRNQTLKYKSRV